MKTCYSIIVCLALLLVGWAGNCSAVSYGYYDGEVTTLVDLVVQQLQKRGYGVTTELRPNNVDAWYINAETPQQPKTPTLRLSIYLSKYRGDNDPKRSQAVQRKWAEHYAFERVVQMTQHDREKKAIEYEMTVPEDYLTASSAAKLKKDPDTGWPQVPGDTHLYVRKFDRVILTAHARNVGIEIYASEEAKPGELKDIALAAFAPLIIKDAADVEVLPKWEERVALVPAVSELPARITWKGLQPKTVVTFALPGNAQGELRARGTKGKTIQVTADAGGNAEARYYFLGAAPLTRQLTETVALTTGSELREVRILVGLGLAFDRVRSVQGQSYKNNLHAFTISVKSTFLPKMHLGKYLYDAEQSGAWDDRRLGIRLTTTWVNRGEEPVDDTSYDGTVNIVAVEKFGTVLTANFDPLYYQTELRYPAVILNSEGKHVYQVTGEIVVMKRPEGNVLAKVKGESLAPAPALVILSREDPERWFQSLACALEAQDYVQYAMLETAKSLPVYGQTVDVLTTATSLLCGLSNEEYEKTFYELGTVLGGKYLERLVDNPDVFSKLSVKQQQAAKAAKKAHDELGNYKSKKEQDKHIKDALDDLRRSMGTY